MFASDRDLLVYEPNLFRDMGAAAQRLVKGTGDVSGTTLTLTAQDVDFEEAGIDAGHVVIADGTPYEVIARLTATTATVSRLRAALSDPVLPPSPATGKPVEVWTFRAELASTHSNLLRMLGIEPADPPAPGRVTEADITNPQALTGIEALGAISLVFARAMQMAEGGRGGWAHPIWTRSQLYRERYEAARQHAAARIDTDGDGEPDATRRLNTIMLVRV
jgi:hypothetical protein